MNDLKIYNKTKKYLEKNNDTSLDEKLKKVSKALEIKDIKKRYEYLYDEICEYLDYDFKVKNVCGFDCDICLRRKELMKHKKKETYVNGCCYRYVLHRNCENLNDDGSCKIKSIGCKLFTCLYLKKKGYHYSLNKIYLSRYFFNFRQKFYMQDAIFIDKDETIKNVLKKKNLI